MTQMRIAARSNFNIRCATRAKLLWAFVFLISCSGCESINSGLSKIGQGSRNIVDYFSGNTPAAAVRKMENASSPDSRWEGMTLLARYAFGKRPLVHYRFAHPDQVGIVRAENAVERTLVAGPQTRLQVPVIRVVRFQ